MGRLYRQKTPVRGQLARGLSPHGSDSQSRRGMLVAGALPCGSDNSQARPTVTSGDRPPDTGAQARLPAERSLNLVAPGVTASSTKDDLFASRKTGADALHDDV